ncbi:TlpA family protein disulfide reductase [Sphingobacterium sp. UBA1498]|uniref:TlpA family protein disulfide reductase n=1 Tax=Sphingobacterium sp. UBA1498 TaxID=1947481 RepID=UPI0025EF1027|nr:TlpA disulfide reductase family protein [Sphingobacterium sp. UBA1498]
MRHILVCIAICLTFFAWGQGTPDQMNSALLSGKIKKYDRSIPFTAYVQRLGLPSLQVNIDVDSNGTFSQSIPIDLLSEIYLVYKTSFVILLQPKDNLKLIFDGDKNSMAKVLESIEYAGDHAKTNQDISTFFKIYYSDARLFKMWEEQLKSFKEMEIEEYKSHIQNRLKIATDIFQAFDASYHPNDECKSWIRTDLKNKYFDDLGHYPMNHREQNNFLPFDTTQVVPAKYFEQLKEWLPLTTEQLKNTQTLNAVASSFYFYLYERMAKEGKLPKDIDIIPSGGILGPTKVVDSLMINSTIDIVEDPLLREIMLTTAFSRSLAKQSVNLYENNYAIIDKYITKPYLKDQLFNIYKQTKTEIETPIPLNEALKVHQFSSGIEEIFKQIIAKNKNKVIYVDIWSPWCGPCLKEMPNSKKLEQKLKNKAVSFIYICVFSDEDRYLRTLNKLQLGGEHYFLNSQQSVDLSKIFNIPGIPYYIYIDKNGVMKEKGSHLRPEVMESKLNDI